MRRLVDNYLTLGANASAAAHLVREMNATDYNELMDRIDKVMASNDGAGPDKDTERESFDWLKRAAALAGEYETRTFEV